MAWPFAVLIVILGPIIGSFLGVLVDRWPLGHSLLSPSACQACRTRLMPPDLVPLWSGLRGRCRHCRTTIPSHLFRIELAATGASVLALAVAPNTTMAFLLAAYMWCLVGLFYADLLHFRLPDPLTAALFLVGIAIANQSPDRSVSEALISACAGAAVFAVLRWGYRAYRGVEGLGLGDVKLIAGIGAGLGWMALPWVTFVAAVLALCVLLAARRRVSASTALPFGAYLCASTLFFILLDHA